MDEATPVVGETEVSLITPHKKPKTKAQIEHDLVKGRRDHRTLARRKVAKATRRKANPVKHSRSKAHKGHGHV